MDTRELPMDDILTEEHDGVAEMLLRNLLKRMPDREPGVMVFTCQ